MFENSTLQNYLQTASSVKTSSLVIAEWNMNVPNNILAIGNYRHRPSLAQKSFANFGYVAPTYDSADALGAYTDATDSYVTLNNGYSGTVDNPISFTSLQLKNQMLFSLEDCFGKFRPRSGANKIMYNPNRYLFTAPDALQSPRYYAGSKDDIFKYWTSYRTEKDTGITRGISGTSSLDIDDAAPFIVYKNKVPANRIIVKMQTNITSTEKKPGVGYKLKDGSTIADPFYGNANKTVPSVWRIQYLDSSNNWNTLSSTDGTPLELDETHVGTDGYVELAFGLNVPSTYSTSFVYAGELSSATALPSEAINGYAYLVKSSSTDIGAFYIWNGSTQDWDEPFTPVYGWYPNNGTKMYNNVYTLVSPPSYVQNAQTLYREFQYIYGLRLVADTMNKADSSLDLIELSPRLSIDLTEKIETYRITKMLSDLNSTGLPVGELLASTGDASLFDYDQAFNENNPNSILNVVSGGNIVYSFSAKNVQVKFWDILSDDTDQMYFIPIKTMYVDGFPETSNAERKVSLKLRDLFFYFESITAPQLLLRNVKLSFAICSLFDSIGFSNFIAKKIDDEDPTIPYFFIPPDTTVVEVLNDLARSTQTAMYFDEYNNFVLMSKEYLLPSTTDRATNYVLSGESDPNIIEISSENDTVYNDGKIVYTNRYLQKSYGTINEASLLNNNQTWNYKPVLLWEVSPSENIRSINEETANQAAYALSAIPLNSNLTDTIPTVGNKVTGLSGTVSDITGTGPWTATITLASGSDVSNIYPGETLTQVTAGTGTLYGGSPTSVIVSSVITIPTLSSGKTVGYTKKLTYTVTGGTIPTAGTVTSFSTQGIINNTIDFGENIYWLGRYNGYLYSNGEIIKFDAIQYQVSGQFNPIWITSTQDYAKYFGGLPFGGQMFPTGLVRIYVEPYYNSNGTYQLGDVVNHGRGQFGTTVVNHPSGIDSYWTNENNSKGFYMDSSYLFENKAMPAITEFGVTQPSESQDSIQFAKTIKTGIIKNFSSNTYVTSSNINQNKITAGTVQASALVMRGGSFSTTDTKTARDHLTFVYKNLDENKYTHFGTRLRIVGERSVNASTLQNPYGRFTFYNSNQMDLQGSVESDQSVVSGASGGLAVMVDPLTKFGYYFEVAALTENNIKNYANTEGSINNIFFYKIGKSSDSTKSIPYILYRAAGEIIVDDGKFTGQGRTTNEKTPSVYDLAIEYDTNSVTGGIRFFLYINDKLLAVVDDDTPLRDVDGKITQSNNVALFIRGSSKLMFENIYAISSNYAQNASSLNVAPANGVFGTSKPKTVDSFRKYLSSGMIRSTYLSGISSTTPPEYSIYFDEFGTIMRECAYFNIRYDKAYPALWAKMSPTFNQLQGYTVSGFSANPYGAEFLIFNNTDTILNLDETSGNYLRIQGVTFTQQSQHDLTVDDFFVTRSNMATNTFNNGISTVAYKKNYADIKSSRATYGKNQFTLESPYIQSRDEAENLMDWITQKIMKPRKSVGVSIFSTPILQLGDIVTINYQSDGFDEVSGNRFVIYNIEYSRDGSGPSMILYLSEVT